MKTITTKYGKTFTVNAEQYQLLSWIATIEACCFGKKTAEQQAQQRAFETACFIVGAPSELTFDIVIEGRIKGYRNMNRLSAGDWVFGVNLKD